MKALYRRYRPKTLSEVVGQEQITSVLEKSLQNGKVAHAYLFIGPRGTGKTSVARILAHEINGFKYELEDDYLDIIEIDAASNTGVDNIRDLREKAIIAPTKGKYKVYIIDEVHMLSKSAFNALLKTLEEPPAHVIFIMATTDAYKVPVTITSRSQTYTFKLANPGTMFDYLKKIAKKEKIKITNDALQIIVKRGGGSFRDSLSLLDQISTLSEDEIDADLLTKALGLPQSESIINILNGYAAGDVARVRTQLQELLETGLRPETIAENIIAEILENPQPIHLGLLDKLLDVSRSDYPDAKLLLALIPQNITQTTPVIAAPIPTPTPKKSVKPEPKPTETKQTTTIKEPSSDDAEKWNDILLYTQDKVPSVYHFLTNADYSFTEDKLTIYVKNKFAKTQLNKKVPMIAEFLKGKYTIEVSTEAINQDSEMAAIAELMGGGEEIQIDAIE